jgi:hypothetical protein
MERYLNCPLSELPGWHLDSRRVAGARPPVRIHVSLSSNALASPKVPRIEALGEPAVDGTSPDDNTVPGSDVDSCSSASRDLSPSASDGIGERVARIGGD